MIRRIGILDSGVGGKEICAAIREQLPDLEIFFFADTDHFPYGNKTGEEILQRTLDAAQSLYTKQIELLVLACHTASVYAQDPLRKLLPIPVIGMVEPTLRAMGESSPIGKLGLLATEATLKSGVYQKQIQTQFPNTPLTSISGKDLAQTIESGAQLSINMLNLNNLDSILLACTHYPLIQHLLPSTLHIIDPASQVVQAIAQLCTTIQNF